MSANLQKLFGRNSLLNWSGLIRAYPRQSAAKLYGAEIRERSALAQSQSVWTSAAESFALGCSGV